MFIIAFKSAFQNIRKHIGFALLNTLGMSLGLLMSLLISLYVIDELSYDNYNVHAGNIYRIQSDLKLGDNILNYAISPPIVGASVCNKFPEVLKAARIFPEKGNRFRRSDEIIQEDKLAYADAALFQIFTLPMLSGDASTALSDPKSIVLTEKAAIKYFNRINLAGETMTMVRDDSLFSLKITGVIRNIPSQSHFDFDFFLSMKSFPVSFNNNFLSFYTFSTYVLLSPEANVTSLEGKFENWIKSAVPDYAEIERGDNYLKLKLMPLKAIHLHSNRKYELGHNGNIQYIYIFSLAAIFIVGMACINFMNLSAARFFKRSKEVGIKKILGSSRKGLVIQFLAESILITFFSVSIAFLSAGLLLPLFNQLSGKSMSVGLLFATWILPTFAGVSFIVGICAGIYPAVLLSSLNPSMVVKGKLSIKPGTLINGFRNVLMITQFSVSIFLIAGTLIIYKQLQYIQDKNVGFNRTRVLVIKNASLLNNPKLFKESMKQIPAISSASLANFLPTNNTRWSNYGWSVKVTNPVETEFWPVDEDYLATMDLQIIAGRNFSKNISSDSSAIILNEAAAKIFSLKNDLVNQSIVYNFHQQQKIFSVIGIVRDFNFNSLREQITPLVMLLSDNIQSSLIVKMETDNLPAVMSDINNQWKKMAPGQQMDYSFMDDDFNAIYKNDQLMGRLFLIFSALAILIACLGLFGLSIHSMEVRNREIGIRKVLGAPVFSLIFLLSKDFIQLVIIAILVTTPIAYVAMFNWINQFAYRQTIRLYDFGIAALIALLIALGTVISLTLMTTKINPVKILKNP